MPDVIYHASGKKIPVFALLPEDFQSMGCPGRPEHVFGRIQRLGGWRDGQPYLSREIRRWMNDNVDLRLPDALETSSSSDGATRVVLGLADGARVEAVHMPREVRNPRVTLCISSQVGCAMGCAFCATGSMGLIRDLTAGEIVGQVHVLLKTLGPNHPHQVTLVFMGMGEPLHNLENVHRAIRVFNHASGLNISARRITLSTAGFIPGIDRLAALRPRPWLAISLNGGNDYQRQRIMPIGKTYLMADLRLALDRWELMDGEKLLIEYVLLDGVNDKLEDAEAVANWLGDLRRVSNVNLISFNKFEGCGFSAPSMEVQTAFASALKDNGCFVTLRKSRGGDIKGACGQLVK
ncbi:MAG: 23S rRNA (adenine(2503)-C(2))-methyltransferase RlmN [Holophagales bacterium]|jgi:23S rRNA (adenine2503-C2)-methyltransferase|nr:23S rRNA (adenine(2503)-C(2))-methyltransferase RlmN [Holophagales bacterium]